MLDRGPDGSDDGTRCAHAEQFPGQGLQGVSGHGQDVGGGPPGNGPCDHDRPVVPMLGPCGGLRAGRPQVRVEGVGEVRDGCGDTIRDGRGHCGPVPVGQLEGRFGGKVLEHDGSVDLEEGGRLGQIGQVAQEGHSGAGGPECPVPEVSPEADDDGGPERDLSRGECGAPAGRHVCGANGGGHERVRLLCRVRVQTWREEGERGEGEGWGGGGLNSGCADGPG